MHNIIWKNQRNNLTLPLHDFQNFQENLFCFTQAGRKRDVMPSIFLHATFFWKILSGKGNSTVKNIYLEKQIWNPDFLTKFYHSFFTMHTYYLNKLAEDKISSSKSVLVDIRWIGIRIKWNFFLISFLLYLKVRMKHAVSTRRFLDLKLPSVLYAVKTLVKTFKNYCHFWNS